MKIIATITLAATMLTAPAFAQQANAPLTIDQAVKLAFENSPKIRIAVDQYAKSTGSVSEAKSNFLPKVTLSATHTRQGPPVSVQIGDISANLVQGQATAAAANVTLPIDISKQLATAADLSKYQQEMDRLNVISQYQQLILDVSNAFFELRRAKAASKVAQSAVDTANERLKNTQARFNAGVSPKFDVDSGEVEVANLTQRLISANKGVDMARAALNTTLGIDVSTPTDVAEEAMTISSEPVDASKAIAKALTDRPEVKTVELSIAMAKFGTRLARLNNAPTLGLSATYNYSLNVGGFSATAGTWVAVLQLSKSLWDGGQTRAKVVQALADESKAKDSLTQVQQGVSLDVQLAVLKLQDAADRAATATKNVTLAAEALRLANVRYEAGVSTLVEVQNSEQALTEAQFNEVNAQYDYAEALAALDKAKSTQPQMASAISLVPVSRL